VIRKGCASSKAPVLSAKKSRGASEITNEALQGKKIVLLPISEGGINLKTTDVNHLIEIMKARKLAKQ
jgi:hypothetical protein